jgi:hypothetical protein
MNPFLSPITILSLLSSTFVHSAALNLSYTQPSMTYMEMASSTAPPGEVTFKDLSPISGSLKGIPYSQALLMNLKSNSLNGFDIDVSHALINANGIMPAGMNGLIVTLESLSEGEVNGVNTLSDNGTSISFDNEAGSSNQIQIKIENPTDVNRSDRRVITLMVKSR